MNVTNDATCKFCYGSVIEDNQFACPCKCTGSLKYVHLSCLENWISQTKVFKCELCNYEYKYQAVYKKSISLATIYTAIVRLVRQYFMLFVKNCVVNGYVLFLMYLTGDLLRIVLSLKYAWYFSIIVCVCVFFVEVEMIKFFGMIQREISKVGKNNLSYARTLSHLTNEIITRNDDRSNMSREERSNTVVHEGSIQPSQSGSRVDHEDSMQPSQSGSRVDQEDSTKPSQSGSRVYPQENSSLVQGHEADTVGLNGMTGFDFTNGIDANTNITADSVSVFSGSTEEMEYDLEMFDTFNNEVPEDTSDFLIDENDLEEGQNLQQLIEERNNAVIRNQRLYQRDSRINGGDIPNYTRIIFDRIRFDNFSIYNLGIFADYFIFVIETIFRENLNKNFEYKFMFWCLTQTSYVFLFFNLFLIVLFYVPYFLGVYFLSFVNFSTDFTFFVSKIDRSNFLYTILCVILGLFSYFLVLKMKHNKNFIIHFSGVLFVYIYFAIFLFMFYFSGILVHFLVVKELNIPILVESVSKNETVFVSVCSSEKYELAADQNLDSEFNSSSTLMYSVYAFRNLIYAIISSIFACKSFIDALRRTVAPFIHTTSLTEIMKTDEMLQKCCIFHPKNMPFNFISTKLQFLAFHFILAFIALNLIFCINKEFERSFRNGVFYYFSSNIFKNYFNYKEIILQSFSFIFYRFSFLFTYFFTILIIFIEVLKAIFDKFDTKFYTKITNFDKLFFYFFLLKMNFNLKNVIFRIFRFSNLILCKILNVQNYFLGFKNYAKSVAAKSVKEDGAKEDGDALFWCPTRNSKYSRCEYKIINSKARNNEKDSCDGRFGIFHIPNFFRIRCLILFSCLFLIFCSFVIFYLSISFWLGIKINSVFENYQEKFLYLTLENPSKVLAGNHTNDKQSNAAQEDKGLGAQKKDISNIGAQNNTFTDKDSYEKQFESNNAKFVNLDLFVLFALLIVINVLEAVLEFIAKFVKEKPLMDFRLKIHDLIVFFNQKIVWSFSFAIYIQAFIDKIIDDDDSIKMLFISRNFVIGLVLSICYTNILFYLRILPKRRDRANFVMNSLSINMKISLVLLLITLIPVFVDIYARRFVSGKYRIIAYCCICLCPFGIPSLYFFILWLNQTLKNTYNKVYDFLYLKEKKISNYEHSKK